MEIEKLRLTEDYRSNVGYVYTALSGSGAGTRAQADAFHAMDSDARYWLVYNKTIEKLESRKNGTWLEKDDDIFSEYHSYVEHSIANTFPQDAIKLWEHLLPEVMQRKAHIDAFGKRLHIGSPLYNTGLCYFLLGDFDTAYQYIAEAGIEDELDGRGSRFEIMIGRHCVSGQIVITPLSMWLDYHPGCRESYEALTNKRLDESALFSLASDLCSHPDNAIQYLSAFHRYVKTFGGPENHASKHSRTRAIADLLVLLESSVRSKHQSGSGQLQNRIEQLLKIHADVQNGFLMAQDQFETAFSKPDREETKAVNWLVQNTLGAWSLLAKQEQRLGAAIFAVVRMRNNLLHKIDPTLAFHTDRLLSAKVMGVVLAVQGFV